MRTEDELRAALRSLEDRAPEVDSVLARLPHVRRRVVRRRTVLLAGAAAVTAAAVPVTARLVTDRDGPPATPPTRHPWVFTAAVDLDGFELRNSEIEATYQRFTISRDDPGVTTEIAVHDRGRYDPTAARSGEPVQVHGRPGFYLDEADDGRGLVLPGVVWEYATDSWAVAHSVADPGGPAAGAIRVAEAVRFGVRVPLRVPFRIGYLPDRVRPAPGSFHHDLRDEQGRPTWATRIAAVTDGAAMQFRVGSEESPGASGEVEVQPVDGGVVRRFETFGMGVAGGGLSQDELLRIAESMTPCPDPTDRSTWFDAVTAIPTG